MGRYRIRAGKQLPHEGQLLEAGEILELPRQVASDPAVRDFVEEVDEGGNPVLAPLSHDFERFQPHEQITLLQGRLDEARARVATLEAQIDQVQAHIAQTQAASSSAAPEGEE